LARTIEAFRIPYSRSIFSKFAAVTAVSEAAAAFVRQLAHQEVQIVPNGIDLSVYKPDPALPAAKTPFVLYIGRLEKRKGVQCLIEAFAEVAKNNKEVKLVIAGDGELRPSLEAYVKENHIPHVEFLGYITEKQKLHLLQQARIFCSPALYGESFGIVLLEAMAMGTVTIAGNNPGYAGVMQDRGKLSLVNPKDIAEFAYRLELLLSDEDLRSLWRKWAKQYVKQFDYKNIVDHYEAIYQKAKR
jgi:phosphatidylinositol alpha-mannosyltransferase